MVLIDGLQGNFVHPNGAGQNREVNETKHHALRNAEKSDKGTGKKVWEFEKEKKSEICLRC